MNMLSGMSDEAVFLTLSVVSEWRDFGDLLLFLQLKLYISLGLTLSSGG